MAELCASTQRAQRDGERVRQRASHATFQKDDELNE